MTHHVVNLEVAESLAFVAIWSCAQPAIEVDVSFCVHRDRE